MKKLILTAILMSLTFVASLSAYTYEGYYPELNTDFFKGNDSPGITWDIAEEGKTTLLRGINYDIPYTIWPGESMLIRIVLPAGVSAFTVSATSGGWMGTPANQNPQFEIFAYDPGTIENAITLDGMQSSWSAGLGRTFQIDGTQESGIGNERAMPGGPDHLEWGRMLYLVCYNVPTNTTGFSFTSFAPTMIIQGGIGGSSYLLWRAARPFAGGTGTQTGDGEYYGSSSINDNNLAIANFSLDNYPNPFNPNTNINYAFASSSYKNAKLSVVNIKGENIWSKDLSSSIGSVDFDGSKLNSGVYYYSLVVDGKNISTKSMILIK